MMSGRIVWIIDTYTHSLKILLQIVEAIRSRSRPDSLHLLLNASYLLSNEVEY